MPELGSANFATSQAAGLPCISVDHPSADTWCSQVCAGWAVSPVQIQQRVSQQRHLTCSNTSPYLAPILHKALALNPSGYAHLPSAASCASGPDLKSLGVNSECCLDLKKWQPPPDLWAKHASGLTASTCPALLLLNKAYPMPAVSKANPAPASSGLTSVHHPQHLMSLLRPPASLCSCCTSPLLPNPCRFRGTDAASSILPPRAVQSTDCCTHLPSPAPAA